jgi:hypothetical protein
MGDLGAPFGVRAGGTVVPDNAPDQSTDRRSIDELQMDALDEHQQYLAALTVCAEMDRMGSTQDEVREVLAALDLLRVADGRRRH